VFSRLDTATDSEQFYNSILDLFDDSDEQEEVNNLVACVSMLLTTVLLMYIYTACWLNNYVVQLCPFWCNSYGARLSRLLTLTEQHQVTGSNPSGGRKLIVAW